MKLIRTNSLGLLLLGLLACQTAEVRTMGLRHAIRKDGFAYLVCMLDARPWADPTRFIAAVPFSDLRIGRCVWTTNGRRPAGTCLTNEKGKAYESQPAPRKRLAAESSLMNAVSAVRSFGNTQSPALAFQVPVSAYRVVRGAIRLGGTMQRNQF